MSYAVGTIYFSEKQKYIFLLQKQYETAHSTIEQDTMLWGVFACAWGKFSNKRKASGCFFQGKETKTITNNIIFPNKNWAPWKRRLSHRGWPDTKAPNLCPPLPPGMSRCQGAHTLERGFLDVEGPDTRAPKP